MSVQMALRMGYGRKVIEEAVSKAYVEFNPRLKEARKGGLSFLSSKIARKKGQSSRDKTVEKRKTTLYLNRRLREELKK